MVRASLMATHITNLNAQVPRPDNHPLTVRGLPQRSREDADIEYFQANTHAQVLDSRTEEELVAEEWLYDGWNASPKTCTGGSRAAMVSCSVNLREEPIVRSRLDLVDFRRQRDLDFRARRVTKSI